ncbi:prolipoprotein diacylglyceryl transferase [Chamaesiphon sp.]|uniref:prolipoprotein diacylglyceryl transferase n=1 Tax=Chamaesiphon sp. TaxID=2814140 RepID=UPI00359443E2
MSNVSLYLSDSLLTFLFTSPGSIIFQVGFLTFKWYGLLIASAVIIGVNLSQYLAKQRDIDPSLIQKLTIWLVVTAIPCARLYYVIFEWSEYARNPGDILAIWKGGIAIHGAIIGGLVTIIVFARWHRISFWKLVDVVAPSLILGQAIGRWGNFFNSEAFGAPTNLPWKLYIPIQQRPPGFEGFEYFHPTFLYESLWNFSVLCLLLTLFARAAKPNSQIKDGTIFLVYLVTYSIGRFWIEGLRTDSLMLLNLLRIAQVISLAGIVVGGMGLIWLYWLKRPLPDVNTTRRSTTEI